MCTSDFGFVFSLSPSLSSPVPLLQFVTLLAQRKEVSSFPEGVWSLEEAPPFDHSLKTRPLLLLSQRVNSQMVSSICVAPVEILAPLNTTKTARSLSSHPLLINHSPPVLQFILLVAPTRGLQGSSFRSQEHQSLRSPSTSR